MNDLVIGLTNTHNDIDYLFIGRQVYHYDEWGLDNTKKQKRQKKKNRAPCNTLYSNATRQQAEEILGFRLETLQGRAIWIGKRQKWNWRSWKAWHRENKRAGFDLLVQILRKQSHPLRKGTSTT